MCGIAAVVRSPSSALSREDVVERCGRMIRSLRHRGPDEQRVAPVGDCVFGHARLSIIDLSTGSQPLYNEDGSIAAILNGEIYNYRELRRELEGYGHRFVTQSDTEVLPHLYEQFGDRLFEHLNGMFALAIWDGRRRRLVAGRDRMGEKPLFFSVTNDGLMLASELRAMRQGLDIEEQIDEAAVAAFLALMYVPAPRSILHGVRKLQPARYLTYEDGRLEQFAYWEPRIVVDRKTTDAEWCERIRSLLAEAVEMRLVADVPLGVFLSGGIDSSAVTALAAQASAQPIRTFTVAFKNEIDERPWAREVAERYGTRHEEIVIDARLDDEVDRVLRHLDEPFGDSSIVPTHIVSRAARNFVTVILSGDGGDELFAGYPMYLEQKLQRSGRWTTKLATLVHRYWPRALGSSPFDQSLHRGELSRARRNWLGVRSIVTDDVMASIVRFVPTAGGPCLAEGRWLELAESDPLSLAFAYDINFYLPGDLLAKVDTASMMASLETRAPFLDHRFVELALSIPPERKLRGDETKALLKRALAGDLSRELLYRPKQGFGAPVGAWLRGGLATLTRDLLAPGCRSERFVRRSALDGALRRVYELPPSSDFRVDYTLWQFLVLERWLRNLEDGLPPASIGRESAAEVDISAPHGQN